MVIEYILFVVGIYLLVKCADLIVDSSTTLAKKMGVSTLIVGLTVVAFGTSLPELIVNIFATLHGTPEIVFGNIIGSNISNILLILGITAILGTITVEVPTVWKEIPFALLASFVLFVLTLKPTGSGEVYLTWADGAILIALFGIYLYYIFQSIKDKATGLKLYGKDSYSNYQIFFKLILGLVGIYFAGKWVVNGAILAASHLGIGEFLISATVIAIGTSLPELAVCIDAVKKKNINLAIGNVIGSNIFNILWVLGIVPLINQILVPSYVTFDIAIMFFATLIFFIFVFTGKHHELKRKEGFVFVLLYLLYVIFIVTRGF